MTPAKNDSHQNDVNSIAEDEQSYAIEHHCPLYFFGSPWKLKSHQFSESEQLQNFTSNQKIISQSTMSAYLISNQIFIPKGISAKMLNFPKGFSPVNNFKSTHNNKKTKGTRYLVL